MEVSPTGRRGDLDFSFSQNAFGANLNGEDHCSDTQEALKWTTTVLIFTKICLPYFQLSSLPSFLLFSVY